MSARHHTRHQWGAAVVRIARCDDGNDRSIRLCSRCGLRKITVHPPQGFPWTEFEPWDGTAGTPPCMASAAAQAPEEAA